MRVVWAINLLEMGKPFCCPNISSQPLRRCISMYLEPISGSPHSPYQEHTRFQVDSDSELMLFA